VSVLGRCPLLVEGDDELRALSELASAAAGSGARVVAITGEAGAVSLIDASCTTRLWSRPPANRSACARPGLVEGRRSRRTEQPRGADFQLAKTADFEMAIDTPDQPIIVTSITSDRCRRSS
jgi:hypothetical protein